MKFILVLFAVISLAYAQKPSPCNTPPQWEGFVFESNDLKSFRLEGLVSIDALYRRQRFVWRQFSNGNVEEIDRLFLEKQKVLYEYNIQTKKCSKIENFTWKDYGVPANSQFIHQTYVGSSAVAGASILTNTWSWNSTDAQGNPMTLYGRWTDIGCIPLNIEGFGEQFGIARINFYDITPGISDPSIFIPRPECLN